MSFTKVLDRLTLAIERADPNRNVEVGARDLWELLREHARLDAEARLTHTPHTVQLRSAVEALKEAAGALETALNAVPSRDELLAAANERIRWERP